MTRLSEEQLDWRLAHPELLTSDEVAELVRGYRAGLATAESLANTLDAELALEEKNDKMRALLRQWVDAAHLAHDGCDSSCPTLSRVARTEALLAEMETEE